MPKAVIFTDELAGLGDVEAAAVAALVSPGAPGLTTGQLRGVLHRAVLALDPDAARKRREKAQKGARVECWTEPAGTWSLAGRDLPPADVLAADKYVAAAARDLKAAGADGTLEQLRAQAFLALLSGRPLYILLPGQDEASGGGRDGGDGDGGSRRPRPGATRGPAPPVGPAPRGGPAPPGDSRNDRNRWLAGLKITWLETGACGHARETFAYQPSPVLRHLIKTRNRTCSYPGCRRAARRCDDDHTIPFDQGGRTCECNLSPLCRRHHAAKQARGWHVDQPQPGTLVWTLPNGRTYTTTPRPYTA